MALLVPDILLAVGSLIILFLGGLHGYYTFFSEKFSPRNPAAELEMKNTSIRLTRATTLWSAWIGFNGSHSLGAVFFGGINLVLLTSEPAIFNKWPVLTFDLLTLICYLLLARRYWFRIPFTGILISCLCFLAASILILTRS